MHRFVPGSCPQNFGNCAGTGVDRPTPASRHQELKYSDAASLRQLKYLALNLPEVRLLDSLSQSLRSKIEKAIELWFAGLL